MNSAGSRSAFVITIGAIVGQGFTMLCMPILSRIYAPQELGYFTVFSALAGLFTTTASLHYELAIPLPKSERQAFTLTILSMLLVLASTLLLCILLFAAGPALLRLAQAPDLVSVQYFLPLSIFLGGMVTILTLLSVRRQRYTANAISKGVQGSTQALVQTGSALAGCSWEVLIVGQLAGFVTSTFTLIESRFNSLSSIWHRRFWLRMLAASRTYKNFPMAAAPSSLINAAAMNVPTLLLAALFGTQTTGLYGLGLRVLQMPMRFVGQSISQVFFGQAAKALHDNQLPQLAERVFLALLAFSLHTFIPLTIIAQPLFRFGFGEQWVDAGKYTQWLSPWLLASFISTPLSMLVTVLQQQRRELVLQMAYLLLICAALLIGWIFKEVTVSLLTLSILGSVFLFAKIAWLLNLAGCNTQMLLKSGLLEAGRGTAIHSILLLPILLNFSAVATTISGIIWIAAIHAFNYRIRGIYAF